MTQSNAVKRSVLYRCVLEKLYAAAADETAWEPFLDSWTVLMGGVGARFLAWDAATNCAAASAISGSFGSVVQPGSDTRPDYAAHWDKPGLDMPDGYQGRLDDPFVSTYDLRRELYVVAGSHYLCGIVAAVRGNQSVGFAVSRAPAQGPYGKEERDCMARLRPHLARAGDLHLERQHARRADTLARRAMDTFAYPVFALDRSRRIVFSNEAASRAVHGVAVVESRRLREADRRLGALLEAATERWDRPGNDGSIGVIDRQGTLRYLAIVVRLRPGSQPGPDWRQPLALMALVDPDSKPVLESRELQTLFALSPAEARIAGGLAQGGSLDSVAAAYDISIHTARSQLKTILQKTGSARPANLVRLLSVAPRLEKE